MFRFGFVLALWLLAGGALAETPPSRPGVDAPELARLGAHGVGVASIVLVQPRQADVLAYDAAKAAAPLKDRSLPVDIWYPATLAANAAPVTYASSLPAEPPRPPAAFTVAGIAVRDAPALKGGFPLVILSHGYSGTPAAMTWLAENLASKGYVVAAIYHRDPDISDGKGFPEPFLRRPLDIAFVAHELQARAGKGALLGADISRMALMGYSMGGYGVLTVAGGALDPAGGAAGVPGGLMAPYVRGGPRAGELAIPGLKAVVAIAPAGVRFKTWGAEGLAGVTTPLLIIAGDQDRTVGFADGIKPVFDQAVRSDRYMLVLQNGGHGIGMSSVPAQMRDNLWDFHWFEDPVWRKDRIMAISQHMITAFLDLHVKGDASRAAYLDTDVAQGNDARWPSPPPAGYSAFSPGGSGLTWKGFHRNATQGLELHHRRPAP